MNYDKTDIFKDKVEPAFEDVKDILVSNKIPFWFTAAVKSSDDKTVYKTVSCSALSMGIDDLHEDRFREYMKIAGGMKAQPVHKSTAIDTEEIFSDEDDIADIKEIIGDDD